MLDQSGDLLYDLQETVAPATDGDGAFLGVIIAAGVILVALEREAD